MTIGTKFHRPSPVDKVLVSNGSRQDARAATCSEESYAEQYDRVVQRILQIQAELLTCGKAALQKEQARIRRHGSNAQTAAEYNRVKVKLQTKREALVKELHANQEQAIRLKPLLKAENVRDNPNPDNLRVVAAEIIDLLKDIRALLEARLP